MGKVKIEKEYTRLVNLGNYENVKVGIRLTRVVENATEESITKTSNNLLALAKKIVEEEIKKHVEKEGE